MFFPRGAICAAIAALALLQAAPARADLLNFKFSFLTGTANEVDGIIYGLHNIGGPQQATGLTITLFPASSSFREPVNGSGVVDVFALPSSIDPTTDTTSSFYGLTDTPTTNSAYVNSFTVVDNMITAMDFYATYTTTSSCTSGTGSTGRCFSLLLNHYSNHDFIYEDELRANNSGIHYVKDGTGSATAPTGLTLTLDASSVVDTPEPASAALLALGAASVAMLRRRRRA